MSRTKSTDIKTSLNNLHLSDIYSLMFFILYKIQDVPEYATISELCYLLDGANITRLITYFAGQTIKIPTADEFAILTSAMLLYQYVNINGDALSAAQAKITDITERQREKATDLYFKLIPILKQYDINGSLIQKDAN